MLVSSMKGYWVRYSNQMELKYRQHKKLNEGTNYGFCNLRFNHHYNMLTSKQVRNAHLEKKNSEICECLE